MSERKTKGKGKERTNLVEGFEGLVAVSRVKKDESTSIRLEPRKLRDHGCEARGGRGERREKGRGRNEVSFA